MAGFQVLMFSFFIHLISMNFQELILKRQSVRKFDKFRPIEEEKIFRILEAGRLAPSASNSQPWTFVAIKEPKLCQSIAKATFTTLVNFNKFAVNSTFFVVLVVEKSKIIAQIGGAIKKRNYPLIDIGIAAENMCLQAEEDGVGSCMLGWFDENKIKELLQIPKEKFIGLVIPFGYAAVNYPLRKKVRKPLEKVVRWNKY